MGTDSRRGAAGVGALPSPDADIGEGVARLQRAMTMRAGPADPDALPHVRCNAAYRGHFVHGFQVFGRVLVVRRAAGRPRAQAVGTGVGIEAMCPRPLPGAGAARR